MKIDVVIPWVDGNDPVLNAKREKYGNENAFSRSDIGGSTRYSNLGEINYCIRSINKFAPFINRIFIVSDGQNLEVESRIPIEIVDHKSIFRGFEEYLPVFNSPAIETMIWNIPNLSEQYLLMNDDTIFIKQVSPEDFFTGDGKVICYGRLHNVIFSKLRYELSVLKYGYRRATFKRALMKGSSLGGMKNSFICLDHTAKPFFKSVFENYYLMHQEAVGMNARHRFRNPEQYLSQALQYAILFLKNETVFRNPRPYLLFIRHWKGLNYVKKRVISAQNNPECRQACFNSLDLASQSEREFIFGWLDSIM